MPVPDLSLRSPSRSTFTVDIGAALRARLNAAAAASGRSPSQLTRELLTRSLAHAESKDQPSKNSDPVAVGAPTKPASTARRIELDLELSRQLDAYKARGGFRSRPAAIRFALETATHYRQSTSSPAAPASKGRAAPEPREFAPLDPAWLKDAAQALIQSNAALQPIGNNLNQIARSLNAMPGLLNGNDAKTIAEAQKQIRAHVEQAARLVHSLRTYITPFAGS